MSHSTTEPSPAIAALTAVVEALRKGDAAGALAHLDALALPQEHALAARALAYRAQALRALARTEEAERAVAEAIRRARAAGDAEGVAQLRQLQASVLASVAARRTADAEANRDADLVDTSDDALLEGAAEPAERASRLLRRAEARVRAGARDAAADDLRAAVAVADAGAVPRESVFARLGLARLFPSDAASHLRDAHALADASDDMNLLTAVAQAARAAGVRLTAPSFG